MSSASRELGESCKVLLVEDDGDTREQLTDILRLWGYVVETATDGEEALERVRQHPLPHVLLVDLLMPRMSGWELIAEINKSERLSSIPLVVLSGCVEETSFLPPADAHLPKPLDLARLHQLLDQLALLRRAR